LRVFAGKAALGVAWKTAGGAKSGSLLIKRTGPSFPAAINAAPVVLDGVHSRSGRAAMVPRRP
jgi:hypothetical protein